MVAFLCAEITFPEDYLYFLVGFRGIVFVCFDFGASAGPSEPGLRRWRWWYRSAGPENDEQKKVKLIGESRIKTRLMICLEEKID